MSIACALAAAVLASVDSSRAAPINYGDFNGSTVQYLQVTEDSSTDATPLYGTPNLSGDSLSFNPVSFGAAASGAGGVDITDGTLKTTIMTTGTKRIHKVNFVESGDYTLVGSGTTATAASIGAHFFLQVVELDGVGVTPIDINGGLSVTPNGGSYDLVNNPGISKLWNGSISLDIDTELANQSIVGQATKILLTLDNSLQASSQVGTTASIHKKVAEGTTVSVDTNVPEPAALSAMVLGAGFLAARRRKP